MYAEEQHADPLVGRSLDDRWMILEPIARGGMGNVYRGVHLELGREVAIKVLSRAGARRNQAVERFLREARVASRIDHPNILEILDIGRLEDGAPYLVMERLEGEELAGELAREAPVSLARVIELLGPIASALDAVHAAGLIHRDIKPSNIFLARRPDGTVAPTLIDFGLAAMRDDEPDRRLTREGVVVGTPHYLSPEAAEGDAVDVRSDVYSLAVVAFQLLTGGLPVDAADPSAILLQKVQKPAPALSARSGRKHPPALEQIMARALSRKVERRPPSAGAFIDALARCESPSLRGDRPPRATARRWIGSLAVLGSLLVASVLLLAAWKAAPRQRAMTAQPLARPTASPEEPPSAVPQVVMAVAPAPSLEGSTDAEPRRAQAPRAPEPSIDAPPEPTTRSTEAPRPPGRAERDARSERAAGLTREAGAAMIRGRFARARDLFRSATEADPTYPAAWRGLGLASERLGLTPEARRAYHRYLTLAGGAPDAGQVRERLERFEP